MTVLRIEVPATSANLGPGFDTLGMALDIVNTIRAEIVPDSEEIVLASVSGEYSQALDPYTNLLCAGYRRWGEEFGVALPGVRFAVENHIPIGRGLGASASAIVAGLAAAAHAGGARDRREPILRLAAHLEGHPDNAAAAVLGGVTTALMNGDEVQALNVVNHLTIGVGLFIPHAELLTADARHALPQSVPLADAVYNLSRTSYLVTALIWGRWELIARAMDDRLHQPYRAALLPALPEVIAAARRAGAYGAALSGGGPTVIALGPRERAAEFTAAMERCATEHNWPGRGMVTAIRHLGVQVRSEEDAVA